MSALLRRVSSTPGWQAGPTSSSCARAAAPRCRRTSRSARTAGRDCASARRSSSAAARRRRPSARGPRLAPLRRGEIPGIRPDRRPYATLAIIAVSIVLTIVGLRRLERRHRSDPRRPARRRLVAPDHDPVPLRHDRLRGRRAQCGGDLRHPARAPSRRVGAAARLPRRRHARHAAHGRGRSSPASRSAATPARSHCSPHGRCATCSAPRRAARTDSDLLGRPRHRHAARPPPDRHEEAHAIAGLGGGIAGLVMGLGLARLRRACEPPRLQRRRGRGGHRGALASPGGWRRRNGWSAPTRPASQRILNEALDAADWFGSAHQAAVLEAAGKPDDRRPPGRGAHADRRGDERVDADRRRGRVRAGPRTHATEELT